MREREICCSFFFNKVDVAFRQRDVLYTLRKAFFPSEGALPFLFDVAVFIEIETVPNVSCNSEEYTFPGLLDLITSFPCRTCAESTSVPLLCTIGNTSGVKL